MLATAVAQYRGSDLLGHLTSLSSRTREGIKGKIKTAKFKERMARLREEMQTTTSQIECRTKIADRESQREGDIIREFLMGMLIDITDPTDSGLIRNVLDEDKNIATEKLDTWTRELCIKFGAKRKVNRKDNLTNNARKLHAARLNGARSQQPGDISRLGNINNNSISNRQRLRATKLSGTRAQQWGSRKPHSENWSSHMTGNIVNSDNQENRAGFVTNKISKRKQRAMEYRWAQLQFRENKNSYARGLIDGSNNNSTDVPDKHQIEEECRKIFVSVGPPDTAEILEFSKKEHNIYMPVTLEQIEAGIKFTKSETAGPDGITKRRLKNIDKGKILILYNSMLLLQYTPKIMRTSRTTLIPKSAGDLDNVKNWRPITISSILLRVLNKIVAWRLAEVELDNRQRGFTRMDGCLANNLTLQTIIKKRRKEGKAYVVITLDLTKAFDSVSVDSIARALRRLRVDDKTRKYIGSNYAECETTIWCKREEVCTVNVKRGVRLGDPMSPILFNMVLDEIVLRINRMEE